MLIATVYLMLARREFDRGYSYLVADKTRLTRGSIVAVPFGKADRPIYGVVTELSEETQSASALKRILFALEPTYALSEATVDLCLYFRSRLLCTFGELAKAALPVGLTLKTETRLVVQDPTENTIPDSLTEAAKALYDTLLRECVPLDACSESAANELIRKNLIRKAYFPVVRTNEKLDTVLTATKAPDALTAADFTRIPAKHIEMYRALLTELWSLPGHTLAQDELIRRFSISRGAINTLNKRGLLNISTKAGYRSPYRDLDECEQKQTLSETLNDDQERAYERLNLLLSKRQGAAALLYGVTGSGKTRVLFHLIKQARKENLGVLFLVPEIGLTSRAAKDLMRFFPNDVTVLHSGLSEGERHDAWVTLANGSKGIALGTRSAVFAPAKNLGLIIIDEEQDQSYNADNPPRFHARDIARFRAAHEKALLILSSATPDVESFHKAKTGKYTLCRLSSRAAADALPDVEITDLKPDLKERSDSLIGQRLKEAITQTLERSEQTILFMNRRGYQFAPFCASCGQPIMCPNCSVALTMHRGASSALCCHYCGYRIPVPEACPYCGAKHLFFRGYGTQKLEEELKAVFPTARVLRMDADSVTAKLSHERFLEEFASGKADILLGTQMVAKGHDFPNVTLVGVVMADTALYLGDYRANEEAFSLLTQVIGRAGRAQKPGRAIIQTLNPEHEIFSLAASQDYERFYQGEIALRKAMLYPPFCHLSAFTLSSLDERLLHEAAMKFDKVFSERVRLDPAIKLIAYGPIEPMIAKMQNRYRLKFVIKHQNDQKTRALFYDLIQFDRALMEKGVRVTYDLTPNQL